MGQLNPVYLDLPKLPPKPTWGVWSNPLDAAQNRIDRIALIEHKGAISETLKIDENRQLDHPLSI